MMPAVMMARTALVTTAVVTVAVSLVVRERATCPADPHGAADLAAALAAAFADIGLPAQGHPKRLAPTARVAETAGTHT
eukprot:833547-Pelagomonas_calceolata.AAC.6